MSLVIYRTFIKRLAIEWYSCEAIESPWAFHKLMHCKSANLISFAHTITATDHHKQNKLWPKAWKPDLKEGFHECWPRTLGHYRFLCCCWCFPRFPVNLQAGSSWFKLVRTVGVNNENGPSNDRSSDWTLRNLIHRAWSYAIRTGAYLSCLINCFQVYIFVSRRGYTNAVKNFEERCNELTEHKTRIRERDELRWRKVAQPLSIFRTKCLMFRSVSRATRKGNQSPLLNRSRQEPNQDNSLLPRIRQLSTKVFSLFKWILC